MKDRDQKIFGPTSKVGATKDLPFQMMGEFEFTGYQAVPGASGEVNKKPVFHFKSGNLTRAITKMIDDDKCDRESFNNYVQVRLYCGWHQGLLRWRQKGSGAAQGG
jgi:hypoxia up-regulated 1